MWPTLRESISESTGAPTKDACRWLGRPRASQYRQLAGPVRGPQRPRTVPDNGQALTAGERAAVLVLINSAPYGDLSIGQVWTRELDEGELPGTRNGDRR